MAKARLIRNLLSVGLALLAVTPAVWAQEVGLLARVGLFDAEFTAPNGRQSTGLSFFADGFLTGFSQQYDSAGQYIGGGAWIANESTGAVTRLGFLGAEYTAANGARYSSISDLAGDYAIGTSRLAVGTYVPWAANLATGVTTRLGYYDAAHTRADGLQQSSVQKIWNGYTSGDSYAFKGQADAGSDAWITNLATGNTFSVGLTGPDFTYNDGSQTYRTNFGGAIVDGYMSGFSTRYNGTTDLGFVAWIANVTTGATVQVGLTGTPFVSANGTQSSAVKSMENGFAAGYSAIYSGDTRIGTATWSANATTGATTQIGLFGAEFTGSDGTQSNNISFFTDGLIAGTAWRYIGTKANGTAVWVATPATGATIRIGLFDAAHTSSTGTQQSVINAVAHGLVGGSSARYSGANFSGYDAWIVDPARGSLTPVGLSDAAHTRADGYQYSSLNYLAGDWAAGTSQKFNGSTQIGQTSWVYNLQTRETDAITLSLRPSDGYDFSVVQKLYETGLAIGQYTEFDSQGNSLGSRAFAWTPEDGAFVLDSLVPGTLSATGWSRLTSANLADPELGIFAGYGTPVGAGTNVQAAYLAIPEPTNLLLVILGACGIGLRRNRK